MTDPRDWVLGPRDFHKALYEAFEENRDIFWGLLTKTAAYLEETLAGLDGKVEPPKEHRVTGQDPERGLKCRIKVNIPGIQLGLRVGLEKTTLGYSKRWKDEINGFCRVADLRGHAIHDRIAVSGSLPASVRNQTQLRKVLEQWIQDDPGRRVAHSATRFIYENWL